MARKLVRVEAIRFEKEIANIGESAKVAIEEMQRELAEEGKKKMQEIILTSGTNKRWTSPWRSQKTGRVRLGSSSARVDSGDMIRAVKSRIEGGRRFIARAAFGWINDFEDYFGYQDESFIHWRSGKKIPGMFALRDARLHVTQQVLPKLEKKYERRIARGIR